MGHRNVLCTNQMLDPKSEQVLSYVHPNHLTHFGEVGDYPAHHMYPVQSTIGDATGLDPQFAGHHSGSVMYGNQQSINQYFHPLSNFRVGAAAQPNIYHSYMMAPSSSISAVPLNNGSASIVPSSVNLRDTGVSDGNATVDSLGHFSRRKDVEIIPGSFYHVAGPPNLCLPPANLSVSSEPLQWGHQYKYAVPVNQPENQGIVICPPTNGADRRVMSGPSSVSIPPEPAFPHHHNTMLHRSYRGQPSQPSNSAWMEQFGNHFVDEGCSSSGYTDQMAYMHGTSVNTGAVMIPNLGMQKYQNMPCNRESGFVTHHPPLPNYYPQHLPPMQNMSINSYNHHSQMPLPPYSHPINNMQSNNVFPPRVGVASDSGYPSAFHSISEQANAPLHESAPEIIHGGFRLLSEDAAATAAALQIRGFYGFDETTDQHRDMRLDIDDMSYEELLALEEHIGVVNTGLPEESILKNLKTSARATANSSERVTQNENCIVCQVEYEEKERIGTLECGHSFHADCIKQWLLVKNLCPICKKPALETDRR